MRRLLLPMIFASSTLLLAACFEPGSDADDATTETSEARGDADDDRGDDDRGDDDHRDGDDDRDDDDDRDEDADDDCEDEATRAYEECIDAGGDEEDCRVPAEAAYEDCTRE